ncbi:MAG: DUF2207 domain-containing protein, partial [Acidobacteria bacterium]|nr:DUF2207 domain-containing protein [Acidobacteriota bacterium]
MKRALCFAVVLLATLGSAPHAAARELHWESLDVRARLDAEGLMHIEERQTMVFTGDWNGGERRFRLLGSQSVKLHGIRRVDPDTGRETELVRGKLNRVDHYDWTGSEVVRWRSRLPSDPPFDGTRILYILEYTLTGTLESVSAKTFAIAPDFVFPDRPGVIEHFSLDFDVDPVWKSDQEFPRVLERSNLGPGQGVVVAATLTYTGNGWPAAVPRPLPRWMHLLVFGLALLAMLWFVIDLWRHETTLGRFEGPDTPGTIDRAWLEEHLFELPPEVAGALWDRAVGPPEVAAVIARLVAEGKLESEIVEKPWYRGGNTLKLRRTIPIAGFSGYDRKLIAGLFVGKGDETDTDTIRKYYRSKRSGFDPSSKIRKDL